MKTLNGKRALVCGGSQGIGRASAVELARTGAEVTVVARNADTLRQVVEQLDKEVGQTHRWISADFSDPSTLQAKVSAEVSTNGPIHILINNSGGPPPGPVGDASPQQLAAAFSNHLLCNQLLVQAVVAGMKEARFGRIINIISTSVIQPIAGLGVSNTIRGAVANWGRTLAGEVAAFGITVNNVLPGYTATGRLRSLFEDRAKKTGISLEQVEQQAIETIPARRLGAPEELAAVVGFLASPAASYITGVNLPVDGGRTAVQ